MQDVYEDEDANNKFGDKDYIEGEEIYYTTGKVAQLIGASRDITRNKAKEFEEFLNLSYTEGNQMKISSKDVELMRNIIYLRKTKTVEEVKELLRKKELSDVYRNQPNVELLMTDALMKNNTILAEIFKNSLYNYIENISEQNSNLEKQNIQMQEELIKLNKNIENLMQQQDEINDKLDKQKKRSFWFFGK